MKDTVIDNYMQHFAELGDRYLTGLPIAIEAHQRTTEKVLALLNPQVKLDVDLDALKTEIEDAQARIAGTIRNINIDMRKPTVWKLRVKEDNENTDEATIFGDEVEALAQYTVEMLRLIESRLCTFQERLSTYEPQENSPTGDIPLSQLDDLPQI